MTALAEKSETRRGPTKKLTPDDIALRARLEKLIPGVVTGMGRDLEQPSEVNLDDNLASIAGDTSSFYGSRYLSMREEDLKKPESSARPKGKSQPKNEKSVIQRSAWGLSARGYGTIDPWTKHETASFINKRS